MCNGSKVPVNPWHFPSFMYHTKRGPDKKISVSTSRLHINSVYDFQTELSDDKVKHLSERKGTQLWGCSLFRFPLRVWEQEFERAFLVLFSEKSSGLMSSRWISQKRRWKLQVGKPASKAAILEVLSALGLKIWTKGRCVHMSADSKRGESLWSTATDPTAFKDPQAENFSLMQ